MNLKCGIVGLPNVGKSTFFNALTSSKIAAENYPFCTIEPNIGVVAVPDSRLNILANLVKSERILPAVVEFVDIAGLVAGASKGEGLGNKFLANIRETHVLVHVIRCFNNPDIIHVSEKIDPISDIEIIETELALADLLTIEKAITRHNKMSKSGNNKESLEILKVFEKIHPLLNQAKPVRKALLNSREREILAPYNLITNKPILYVANVDESGFKNNPLLDEVQRHFELFSEPVIPICATLEAEIANLSSKDKQFFLDDLGLKEPGLNKIIQACFQLLGLQTFFTVGEKEIRAWTIPIGSTAPQSAGVIHTDFEKGFIRAQTISYTDFVRFQGETGAKEAGKMRTEGKDYIVQDGDVMNFLFNV